MDQYKFYDPAPKKLVPHGFSSAVQISEGKKGLSITGDNRKFIWIMGGVISTCLFPLPLQDTPWSSRLS